MENKQTILVTGANGQLATSLANIAFEYPQFNFLFANKNELPINDFIAVANFFNKHKIDVCINCAAYTAVDKAETEIEKAYLINADAVGNLAAECKKHQTKLIHISTDYVFDGTATQPINERETTNPISVYGASKLKGEQLCLQNNPHAIIIRTSWVYGVHGNNFVKTMLRLMSERESINVVDDQIGIPTNTEDLAKSIIQIVKQFSTFNFQLSTFNYSNSGSPISWYQFALAVKEISKSNCLVNPIPTSQYPTPAKRPVYSVLNTTLIQQIFNVDTPNWKESLEKTILALTN